MTTELHDEDEYVAVPSLAQRRLWVMEQIEDGAPTYNIQVGVRLRGTVDITVLQRVVDEIVRRHETMRTRMASEDGELIQLISAQASVPVAIRDLTAYANPSMAWKRVADDELKRPFDLERDLPVRVSLLRLADNDHVLLVTLDHIVCDAWSLRLLHQELVSLYPAFAAGQESPLPELLLQHADYAAWEQERQDGPELRRQLEYWRGQLGDNPPRLSLYAAGAVTGTDAQGMSCSQRLPEELMRDLEALALRNGVSLFSVLLSGFSVVLSRYSRQDEFVLGSVLTGRTRPELESLIGFFVNTVGLRVDLSNNPTFRELLGQVHGTALDAYANQDVSFDRVVEELDPDFEPGHRQPFFDTMFQLLDLTRQTVRTDTLVLEPLPFASLPASVEMVLAVVKDGDDYECVWDYRSERLGLAEVRRMQHQYLHVMRAALTDPDCRVDDLELEAASATSPRGDISAADGPEDESWTFFQHFDEVVDRAPDAVALVDARQRFTYAELRDAVDRLAHVLREHGTAPETLVGVCLERGAQQVIATLAVMRAGGAFLPLEPSYPAERLRYMVADAAPPLIITSAGLVDRLPEVTPDSRVLTMEELTRTAETTGSPSAAPAHVDQLAYVIYTSGSSGSPKAVCVTHRGLRTILRALDGVFALSPADRVLRFASFSFDVSILEILMAFGSGASLHVAPADNADLSDFLRDGRITTLVLPPSGLAALVADDADLPELRTVMVGGEACPPALADQWAQGRRFFNGYGPTEATIVVATHQLHSASGATVPLGTALPGVQLHILDYQLRPVPAGVPGELYVGGPVLARGYLGHPRLTAERFLPDTSGVVAGGRIYRTGDLVRRNEQGTIDFLGRLDDQVKVRGFRIELGEIENALARHPAVREAAAAVREGASGSEEIVAYVVPHPDKEAEPLELRSSCACLLPSYMVPSQVLMLDSLPTSGSGKLDRRALPTPGRNDTPAETRDDQPLGPLEAAIAEIWVHVLNADAIGRNDDFFDLGGNSLSATQVTIRLRQDFALELPVRTLFDNPELGEFVQAVREAAVVQGAAE
ncbi:MULTISPECIES: amino acid adenylation domain-containing protein [unclassified Streptomyces]|uniref:non-ribosomal peptide synthetase n=1 Tax=unclassified Streptomyces TaxID=2593676 RepID=UPI00381FB132